MPCGSTVIFPLEMASSSAGSRSVGQEDLRSGDLLRMSLKRERNLDLPMGLKPLPAGGCGCVASSR